MNVLSKNIIVGFFLTITLFFSAISGFWVYTRISFGNYNFYKEIIQKQMIPLQYYTDLSRRETLIILPFFVLVFLFGIKPHLLIDFLESSLIHGIITIDNKYRINIIHQMLPFWVDVAAIERKLGIVNPRIY